MQKHIASLFALVVIALLAVQGATATAQENPTTTAPATPATVTDQTVPVLPAATNQLSPQTQARVINLAANMSNRAEAMIARFENIAMRVESRIAKMEQQGHDTVDAQAYLVDARGGIEAAKANMVGIDAKVNAFVTAQNYHTGWFVVRDALSETKSNLERTKNALAGAVEDLELALQDALFLQISGGTTAPTGTNPNPNPTNN